MTDREHDGETQYISYEEFGRRFFARAVTTARIAAGFDKLAGSDFDYGPKDAGPGDVATLSAVVRVGEPEVARVEGDAVAFDVLIPLTIELTVDLTVDKQRYDISGTVVLHLTARGAEDLLVVIDIAEPSLDDVHVDVSSESLSGDVLRLFASIDEEIKKVIVNYISREMNKERIEEARTVDIGARVDSAGSNDG